MVVSHGLTWVAAVLTPADPALGSSAVSRMLNSKTERPERLDFPDIPWSSVG